jgi:predicted aspartyl protease
MLIDTGAVPSAINRRVAKRLGLSGSAEQISEVNRSVTVERVRVPRVQIGPVSVGDIGMVAVDLATVENALGTRIDAIIGLDVLARRNFTLDYGRKTVNFGSRMEGECVIGMDTRQEAGGTYVLVEVESGGQKLRLLLDTGSKDVTLFEREAAKKFAPARGRGAEVTVTAGGRNSSQEVEVESMRLGSIVRKKQNAYAIRISEDADRGFDGLLGPVAVGVRVIGFDFEKQRVSLVMR